MVDYLHYFRPSIASLGTTNKSIIFILIFLLLVLFGYMFVKNIIMLYRGAKHKDPGIGKIVYVLGRLILLVITVYLVIIAGQILLEFMQSY